MDGLPWITFVGAIATEGSAPGSIALAQRVDVREMLVQLCPLKNVAVHMSPDEWHIIMAVGAGLSNLKATRLTDVKTIVSGVLSDNPPLLCEFSMRHTRASAIVFCVDTLKMFLLE